MEHSPSSQPPGHAPGPNGQSLAAWPRAHLQVLLILLVGSATSVACAWISWSQVAAHQAMEFQWVAQDRNRALKKGVEDALKAVLSLEDLMRLNPQLKEEDFRQFSAALRARYPGLYSLEWLPWVPGGTRERHEAEVRERIPDYGIHEGSATGARVAAGPRADYFPILLLEPPPSGKPPLGFDRGSDPGQRALIERAIQSRDMVLSGRIPLDPDTAQYGVMVFVPVFNGSHAGAGRQLRGLVVGILQLTELANHAITLLEPRGVEFLIRDESAPPGENFLDFYASRLGPEPRLIGGTWQGWSLPDAPHVTEAFDVGDRRWSITCAATQYYRSAEGFKEGPWILLLGGLAVTALAALFVHSIRAQMRARLRIEAELRESEQKLRILFNQSPDIIMTVNEAGNILLINRALPKASSPEQAQGKGSMEFLPKGIQDWYCGALQRVFRVGEADHFQYSLPDSSCWEVRIVPLRVGGVVTAAMVIATDVTERRLLEAQAIRNARLATLGVLAASVAHEINNPNSAIQFNALLLQKSYADMAPLLRREADQRGHFLVGGVPVEQALTGLPRLLDGLVRNSQRIQTIIANLKHMARQDRGEYDQPVDLGKVLQAVYSILQHQIQKRTDRCQLNLPDGLPPIRGNAQQLEQVFINLMLNALQALPDRSAGLWISAEPDAEGGQVRVSLVDQGSGIGDEDLQHIFDPFFTTRPDQGGTGLGLSISQRIVQNHGGSIEINSQPGVGTEVVVRLPSASPA